MTTFKGLGLSEEIIRSILDAGYTTPTAIQSQAIPVACSGVDLIASAQTGTGKTAAFVLPMLSRLTQSQQGNKRRVVRALVVAPTRELAMQVEQAIRTYGKHSNFRSLAVYGGTSMHPQLQSLRRGVDIIVATPGRLLDHLGRGSIDLSQVEILVLDEGDRMLDMGFLPDIKKVVARTPETRQTLLFSATMPKPLQTLAKTIMDSPQLIQVGEHRNPAATVYQQVCMVPSEQKMDLLLHVLESETMNNVIIFSRTKHRADRINKKLGQSGFSATVIHSNRSQGQRQKALAGFKSGQFQFMVATDIAARGIDVDSISHVINYDTPHQADDYIHRIGRTGRAETTGEAITFVAADEVGSLRQIERHTGQKLDRKVYHDFELGEVSESSGGARSNRGGSSRNGSSRYDSSRGGSSRGGSSRSNARTGGNARSGGSRGRSRDNESSGGRTSGGATGRNGSNRSGSGYAASTGADSGNGDATRSSSGNGRSTRSDSSNGRSTRSDSGNGRSTRSDSGNGRSTRSDSGNGRSTRSDSGNGRSTRSDSGNGRSTRSESGNGRISKRGSASTDSSRRRGGNEGEGESRANGERSGANGGSKPYRAKTGKPYAKKAKRGRKRVVSKA